jgi:hypothetical protein
VFHAVLLAGWLFAQSAPGSPIVPSPDVHVTNTTVVQVPPMDPQAVSDADAIANQSFVVNTVQPVPVTWVNTLCSLPNIWTTTPPEMTYGNSDLVSLANLLLVGALALSGLAILGASLNVMYGADPQETLGRVVFASVLAVGNQLWWRWGIDLNNALTGAIGPPDLCNSLIKPHIELAHPDLGSDIAEPALVIVYAIVALIVLFALWFRMGWIDFLFAGGSLALICWAHVESEHIAQWYRRLSIATLFGQVLLAIGLRTAKVTSSPAAGLGAVLVSIVILWICKDLLSTLASQTTARGRSMGAAAVGVVVRRLITKVL